MVARVQELEKESNELLKVIEQLCMQQAGPAYIEAQLHFLRSMTPQEAAAASAHAVAVAEATVAEAEERAREAEAAELAVMTIAADLAERYNIQTKYNSTTM